MAIRLADILNKLRSIPWRDFVQFAFLTGSLAIRGTGNDVDIVVSRIDSLERYGELLYIIVKAVGVNEDLIDLVPIDENTPCPFIVESLSHSIPLYVSDWDQVFRIFNICLDQQMDARKLNTLETALEVILHAH